MELKLIVSLKESAAELCSNRTFMELKSRTSLNAASLAVSSNRTFMELKSSQNEACKSSELWF